MQEDSQSQPHKQVPKLYSLGRSWENLLKICLLSFVLIAILPFFESTTQEIKAVSTQSPIFVEKKLSVPLLSVYQENALLTSSEPLSEKPESQIKKIEVIVTAYSSTSWETDDTPFITAAGTFVRSGIVAANFLPFGTQIKIPEIYGDEVFIVEDRMHPRNQYHVDIWFPSHCQALNFGAKRTYVEILEG